MNKNLEKNKELGESYNIIRKHFVEKLQNWLPMFEEFRNKMEFGNLDNKDDIFTKVHNLSGSATMFGFGILNEHASKLDEAFYKLDEIDNKHLDEKKLASIKTDFDFFIHEANRIVNETDFSTLIKTTEKPTPESSEISADKTTKDYYFHILVVDDDEFVREHIKLAFSKEKCRVTLLDSGQDVIEYMEQKEQLGTPDMLLLDINMPDMSGFDVLEQLKTEPKLKNIPVMMITARGSDKDVIRGISSGALDYITKPFEISTLTKRVIHILKQRSNNILIADNDELICSLLKEHFSHMGYKVVLAHDGIDALKKMQAKQIDIAILDIMMPVMDGLTVLNKMKKNPKTADIPVVVLTAKKQEDDILEGLKAGAYDYITKPFDVDEFEIRVSRILQHKKRTSLNYKVSETMKL